jgi:hypothetical protein
MDGCKALGGKMGDCRELSADDWRMIYEFEKYIALPFMHALIERARRREGLSVRTGRLVHGNTKQALTGAEKKPAKEKKNG